MKILNINVAFDTRVFLKLVTVVNYCYSEDP
jgi:hypothetical protein